jgi:hypothetical protein
MDWLTIDSAPKDGTPIWAFFPFANESYRVEWRSNVYDDAANWTLDDGESATQAYDPPSHWMPLPAPPTEFA